jgi:hypothetical protein
LIRVHRYQYFVHQLAYLSTFKLECGHLKSPRHFRHFVTSLRFAKLRNFDGNLRKFVILIAFYESS